MRRTLTITAIALVLVGAGVAAYFYFFAPSATVSTTPGATLPVAGQQPVTDMPGVGGKYAEPGAGTGAPIAVTQRLVQISAGPVVPGEAVVNLKAVNTSSTPEVAVTYVERVSGNVFTYLVKANTLTRVNNKTIPGIQSASWLPNGSLAYVRYLSGDNFSTINTYALMATSSTGFFLPQNISDLAVSAAGILTLASGVNGSSVSLARTDGSRSVILFTTPLSSLRVSFAGKNQYLIFSKPSETLGGAAFLTDGSGRLTRIAGPLPGLVALASPSGKWVLVSYTRNGAMGMEVVNTATGVAFPIPVATIADKCVWTSDDSVIYCGIPMNPDASHRYPDDWYQGAAPFSDRIWKIDVAGRYAQLTLDFSQANRGNLDAEALAIDPSRTVLVFVNKNDGSLWSYSL